MARRWFNLKNGARATRVLVVVTEDDLVWLRRIAKRHKGWTIGDAATSCFDEGLANRREALDDEDALEERERDDSDDDDDAGPLSDAEMVRGDFAFDVAREQRFFGRSGRD